MDICTKLKKLREEKGYSVPELCEDSGVSQPYIRQIESGIKKNPSGSMLQKLASALGTTVADLIGSSLAIPGGEAEGCPQIIRAVGPEEGEASGYPGRGYRDAKGYPFQG